MVVVKHRVSPLYDPARRLFHEAMCEYRMMVDIFPEVANRRCKEAGNIEVSMTPGAVTYLENSGWFP